MHLILRGADHPDLGSTASLSHGADLGVALTRGRHLKRYAYTDPNEDVVAAVREDTTAALVVADGHSGLQASHVAVDAVLDAMASGIPRWDRRAAVLAFHDVNERIRAARSTLAGPARASRTTLVVAVVDEDAAGERQLTHACVGDSAVIVLRDGIAQQVTRDRQHFLGDRLSAPQVAGAMDYGQHELEPEDVVIVVSDGYTNFARPSDLDGILAGGPSADAEALARGVVDVAGDAGAGDNVAVAVLLPAAPTDRQA